MAKRKIALFGGTFDPVHIGHTIVAAEAAEHIGADKVIFIPAKRSVLKDFSPKAGDEDRLKMTALAIAGNKNFEVSDYELKKQTSSYTFETVTQFQADCGADTEIYWLLGADSLDDLPRWYRITDLIDLCNLSVMYRAGFPPPDFAGFEAVWGPGRVEKLKANIIQTSLIDISSTKIREAAAAGRDVTEMLLPPVADYIHKLGLYRP